MTGPPDTSNELLAQAHKAGQAHSQSDHHEKSQSAPGLVQQSRAAGEVHGEERQMAEAPRPNETWMEFIVRTRAEKASSDGDTKEGYERGRERSLPDEQREDKSRGR